MLSATVQAAATRAAAEMVAELATGKVDAVRSRLVEAMEDAGVDPEQARAVDVGKAVERATTQDSTMASKRLWAVFLPVLSTAAYALLDPSLIGAFVAWLQAHPGAWWGVAANVVAILLPMVSKLLDPRPVRSES